MSGGEERGLLVLHTSEPRAIAGARLAGRLAVEVLEARAPQARTLLGAVEVLLGRLGARLADIDGLVVTTGPGSFTGLRVGLATAKGLSAARGWQLFSCDSLKPHAAALGGRPQTLAVVQDARRGEVYAALYDVRGRAPRELLPPVCADPESAARRLAEALSSGVESAGVGAMRIDAVGSGVEAVRPELERAAALRVLEPVPPEALVEALLGLAEAGGCRVVTPYALEPEYLRKPDAEPRGRPKHA